MSKYKDGRPLGLDEVGSCQEPAQKNLTPVYPDSVFLLNFRYLHLCQYTVLPTKLIDLGIRIQTTLWIHIPNICLFYEVPRQKCDTDKHKQMIWILMVRYRTLPFEYWYGKVPRKKKCFCGSGSGQDIVGSGFY